VVIQHRRIILNSVVGKRQSACYHQFSLPRSKVMVKHAAASLGLVSPGAKYDDFFSHRPFFSCRLLTTPIFPRRLSNVLSKFSHKKF